MKKTPTEITAFWFAFVTIVICTPLMYFLNVMTVPVTALEWSVVCIVGVFSVLGQVAFTLALKITEAGPGRLLKMVLKIAVFTNPNILTCIF